MQCPKCHYPETKVYDTRTSANGKSIRRRRKCIECKYRFTTLEVIKVLDLKVEKRNGQVVDFDESKLEFGIRKAFNKRNIDNQKISDLVQKVIDDILATSKNPIKTTKIGRLVLKNLKSADEAAYICFGAMFWSFETREDFDKLMEDF